jgi:hypothetical protein
MAGESILRGNNSLVWVFVSPGVITPTFAAPLNPGGLEVITATAGLPALTNANLIESATTAELGLDKNADTRYYLGGRDEGEARESTATCTGQIAVDIAAATTATGYDLPYDLLIKASNTLNLDRLVVIDTYLEQTTGTGLAVYDRRMAIVKVSSKQGDVASAGQKERTFQLRGSSFIQGIVLK